MSRTRLATLALCSLIAGLFNFHNASKNVAYGTSPPCVLDHETPTPDGKSVFVQFTVQERLPRLYIACTNRELRQKYPVAGLYDATNPSIRHWQASAELTGFSKERMSTDGRYVVGFHESIPSNDSDAIIGFFDRGKLIRSWRVRDLFTNPQNLPKPWSPVSQPDLPKIWLTPREFNHEKSLFSVQLLDGSTVEFDMITGEPKGTQLPMTYSFLWSNIFCILPLALLGILSVALKILRTKGA